MVNNYLSSVTGTSLQIRAGRGYTTTAIYLFFQLVYLVITKTDSRPFLIKGKSLQDFFEKIIHIIHKPFQ